MTRSIEITVKVGCPVDCGFCPQSKIKAAYTGEREFKMENYIKILEKLPRDCRIDFSGFTEPLIHHDAGHMMCEAKNRGFEVHLYTTLVGLTLLKLAAIKECHVDYIRIHVPDLKAMVVPDDQWLNLHRIFMGAKLPATYMAMGEMTPKVGYHLKSLGIEVDMPKMLSRGGLLWKDRHLTGAIRCHADRWHQNVVLPNGAVYSCCMDYSLTMPLGNLLTDSYAEIDARASAYADNNNPPDNSVCRDCDWCAPK